LLSPLNLLCFHIIRFIKEQLSINGNNSTNLRHKIVIEPSITLVIDGSMTTLRLYLPKFIPMTDFIEAPLALLYKYNNNCNEERMIFMQSHSRYLSILRTDYTRFAHNRLHGKSYTLDFCRGMAVIFMVFVHVLGVYARPEVYNSTFGSVVDFLGSPPAAPVFMVTMGIFFMLSSKTHSLSAHMKRGLSLMSAGMLLSFLRSDLMMLIDGETYSFEALWEIDILPFAGCAYILMSLICHFFKKPITWLIIATLIMLTSPYLWGLKTGSVLIDWFLHFLWGNDSYVYFPVFGWLFYPLVGMVIGVLMKATKDDQVILKSLYKPGMILLLIGSVITLTNPSFHIGDYFRSGQGAMIWILGFVFIWFSLANNLCNLFHSNVLIKKIRYWGRETPSIYVIHWLLISWATYFLGYENKGYIMTVYLMFLTLIISHFISRKVKVRV